MQYTTKEQRKEEPKKKERAVTARSAPTTMIGYPSPVATQELNKFINFAILFIFHIFRSHIFCSHISLFNSV
ncbi:unnamed protein product [Meloidogyne enterolobii]|uniref:Uncharacterized protein n=1 Tax=Meloidogyne enterolobii TaxID=390850 RepID=A0ACB0ZT05_MELEN